MDEYFVYLQPKGILILLPGHGCREMKEIQNIPLNP